ncbi:exodeoxyribonuclease VII small subunit [Gammaproteobacteria bacterium]
MTHNLPWFSVTAHLTDQVPMTLPAATPDFEQSIKTLETLVERMERGELSLEQSLQDFERGVELVRTCRHALDTAEQRVQILMEKEGVVTLIDSDFEAQRNDD